jgi:hypothetical protein
LDFLGEDLVAGLRLGRDFVALDAGLVVLGAGLVLDAGLAGAARFLTAFGAVAFFATAVGLDTAAFGLGLVVVALLATLLGFLAGAASMFSLECSGRDLGGSLTLPEGPLGRTKVPFSDPWAIALLS